MTLMSLRVAARANWGRWIVDCPACPSADKLAPLAPLFVCVECGMRVEVEWPSPDMVRSVERLLMMRPNPMNRNWEPGETLPDLLIENAVHGLLDDLDAGPVLGIEGDRIVFDALPAVSAGPTKKALVA